MPAEHVARAPHCPPRHCRGRRGRARSPAPRNRRSPHRRASSRPKPIQRKARSRAACPREVGEPAHAFAVDLVDRMAERQHRPVRGLHPRQKERGRAPGGVVVDADQVADALRRAGDDVDNRQCRSPGGRRGLPDLGVIRHGEDQPARRISGIAISRGDRARIGLIDESAVDPAPTGSSVALIRSKARDSRGRRSSPAARGCTSIRETPDAPPGDRLG